MQGLDGTSPHYLKWFTQNHFDRQMNELSTVLFYALNIYQTFSPHSWIDESPLWKKTVDVSVTTAEIVSCLTFATEGELKTGHSSAVSSSFAQRKRSFSRKKCLKLQLTLMTDATAVNYSVIFVHPRGDTFLGINQLYGRDHFFLKRLKAGDFGRNFLFEIHTTKRTVLDKESLPCEGDGDKAVAHIRDCLDEAFEKKQVRQRRCPARYHGEKCNVYGGRVASSLGDRTAATSALAWRPPPPTHNTLTV